MLCIDMFEDDSRRRIIEIRASEPHIYSPFVPLYVPIDPIHCFSCVLYVNVSKVSWFDGEILNISSAKRLISGFVHVQIRLTQFSMILCIWLLVNTLSNKFLKKISEVVCSKVFCSFLVKVSQQSKGGIHLIDVSGIWLWDACCRHCILTLAWARMRDDGCGHMFACSRRSWVSWAVEYGGSRDGGIWSLAFDSFPWSCPSSLNYYFKVGVIPSMSRRPDLVTGEVSFAQQC